MCEARLLKPNDGSDTIAATKIIRYICSIFILLVLYTVFTVHGLIRYYFCLESGVNGICPMDSDPMDPKIWERSLMDVNVSEHFRKKWPWQNSPGTLECRTESVWVVLFFYAIATRFGNAWLKDCSASVCNSRVMTTTLLVTNAYYRVFSGLPASNSTIVEDICNRMPLFLYNTGNH